MTEREERRRRHILVTLVDVRFGSPVAAAIVLPVVDRALTDVPWPCDRQLAARVRDAKDGVGDRGSLMRPAVKRREHGRQFVDHHRQTLRTPIDTTAIVGLPSAVIALTSSTCWGGRSMLAVSPPSPSVRSLPNQPALPPT